MFKWLNGICVSVTVFIFGRTCDTSTPEYKHRDTYHIGTSVDANDNVNVSVCIM